MLPLRFGSFHLLFSFRTRPRLTLWVLFKDFPRKGPKSQMLPLRFGSFHLLFSFRTRPRLTLWVLFKDFPRKGPKSQMLPLRFGFFSLAFLFQDPAASSLLGSFQGFPRLGPKIPGIVSPVYDAEKAPQNAAPEMLSEIYIISQYTELCNAHLVPETVPDTETCCLPETGFRLSVSCLRNHCSGIRSLPKARWSLSVFPVPP